MTPYDYGKWTLTVERIDGRHGKTRWYKGHVSKSVVLWKYYEHGKCVRSSDDTWGNDLSASGYSK